MGSFIKFEDREILKKLVVDIEAFFEAYRKAPMRDMQWQRMAIMSKGSDILGLVKDIWESEFKD